MGALWSGRERLGQAMSTKNIKFIKTRICQYMCTKKKVAFRFFKIAPIQMYCLLKFGTCVMSTVPFKSECVHIL